MFAELLPRALLVGSQRDTARFAAQLVVTRADCLEGKIPGLDEFRDDLKLLALLNLNLVLSDALVQAAVAATEIVPCAVALVFVGQLQEALVLVYGRFLVALPEVDFSRTGSGMSSIHETYLLTTNVFHASSCSRRWPTWNGTKRGAVT